MFNRLLILSLWVLSIQFFCFGQTDLKVEVAKQVERIKLISGISEMSFGELPGTSWGIEFLPKENPIRVLVDKKMEVIPFLIPYIGDNSLTQGYRRHGSGWQQQATVSEYICFIIGKITEHTFDGKYTDKKLDVEDYQNQILEWWKKNHQKSLLERKLEEVNDPIHTNRFSAYEYLGKTKQGQELLEKRIQTLLTGEFNSLKQSEMVSCAEALVKIGNAESANFIRMVCEHLSYWFYMGRRNCEVEGCNGRGSNDMSELFRVYKTLADFGFKEEAVSKLTILGNGILLDQKEFNENLEKTKQW